MPVPAARTDLSATVGSNSPAGTEAVLPNLDNYLRAAFGFIKQNYDDIQTGNTNLTTRVPSGIIVAWSGSQAAIPTGWVLCNGSNGTPDLRNRFIVGAGSTYAVGATGGATTATPTLSTAGAHTHTGVTGSHVLTTSEMPAHTHADIIAANTADPYYINLNRISGTSDTWAVGDNTDTVTDSTGGGAGHTHTISSDGDHTHTVTAVATLPPYYALCYIQKT